MGCLFRDVTVVRTNPVPTCFEVVTLYFVSKQFLVAHCLSRVALYFVCRYGSYERTEQYNGHRLVGSEIHGVFSRRF
jgi:hypothetical protein